MLDTPAALPALVRKLAQGLARRQGFVAHIAIPTAQQAVRTSVAWQGVDASAPCTAPSAAALDAGLAVLAGEPFAIWLGFAPSVTGRRRPGDAAWNRVRRAART